MSDTDQATTAATDRTKQYKEASDKLRERSDAAAKTLAGLGTAGLTAVGISKFSDVFPEPPGQGWWIAAVIAGFIVMTAALAAFTFRMLDANRPLVTDVVPTAMDADTDEAGVISGIYDATAKRNGLDSLRAYEARGLRLQRIADRMGSAPDAAPIKVRAERIRADSEATQARAALVISRDRMTNALKGVPASLFAVAFVAGLLAFGIGADRLDSERAARLTAYKACADAVTAKVKEDRLPPLCKGVVVTPPAPPAPTPEQTRAGVLESLGSTYRACVDTAVKQKQPVAMCDGIRVQLTAAAK